MGYIILRYKFFKMEILIEYATQSEISILLFTVRYRVENILENDHRLQAVSTVLLFQYRSKLISFCATNDFYEAWLSQSALYIHQQIHQWRKCFPLYSSKIFSILQDCSWWSRNQQLACQPPHKWTFWILLIFYQNCVSPFLQYIFNMFFRASVLQYSRTYISNFTRALTALLCPSNLLHFSNIESQAQHKQDVAAFLVDYRVSIEIAM